VRLSNDNAHVVLKDRREEWCGEMPDQRLRFGLRSAPVPAFPPKSTMERGQTNPWAMVKFSV